VPNFLPIYVEMRAYGLHTHEGGAIGACEAACAFIRETLLAEEDSEWTGKVINGAAPVSYVKYLHRIAGRIKRRQKRRAVVWRHNEAEATRSGLPPRLIPDLEHGLGAWLDTPNRAEKRALLLDMALGVFTSAGVVHPRVQREAEVSNLGDLLLYSLDDLEEIAAKKGGIRILLDEKWRKVYKANALRGVFSDTESRRASAA
jgi:hypothetical protein